ncbi:hypothetical protein SDIAM26S_05690 [Streptomyces diastaticus subsp. diastaticus]
MIETQQDNWTLAVLVPDQMGKREAMQYGFPKDNIAIWDATSTQGLHKAGQVIQEATEKFMVGRTKGIRGSRAVFSRSLGSSQQGHHQGSRPHSSQPRLLALLPSHVTPRSATGSPNPATPTAPAAPSTS